VNLAIPPAIIDWQPRTRLIFGPGVVARAGALAAELGLYDVLLVCDEGMVRAGYADTVQQLLNTGLLDEISVDIAAVLLGSGVRLFDHLAGTPAVLGNPTVTAGVGVTHLRYPVRKS